MIFLLFVFHFLEPQLLPGIEFRRRLRCTPSQEQAETREVSFADYLLTKGQKVRAIGRDTNRLQPLVSRGAEAFAADLADAARLAKAFAGTRAVHAMIPPAPASNPDCGRFCSGGSVRGSYFSFS